MTKSRGAFVIGMFWVDIIQLRQWLVLSPICIGTYRIRRARYSIWIAELSKALEHALICEIDLSDAAT